MTHQQKVDRLIAEAQQRGISPEDAAPPFFRWLWRADIEIPLPYFIGFWPLVLLRGGVFGTALGIFFGTVLAADLWIRGADHPANSAFLVACGIWVLRGGAFGLAMTMHFHRQARRLCLPAWKDYGKSN